MKKSFRTAMLVLFSALLMGMPKQATAQTICDQTLSVGSNLVSAVSAAPNGSTICLNGGSYGKVSFSNISRSGFVTVRSASGLGAAIELTIGNSRFIKFQSLTLGDVMITSCSANIQVLNSTFSSNGGLLVNMRGSSCPGNLNLLVDGNTFGDLGPALWEGRLSVGDNSGKLLGLTISNNTFGPGCQSDGIQLVDSTSGVTIGPGNIFDGIVQSGSVHCDMIQFYGSGGRDNVITGNWFRNGSVALTHHTEVPSNTVFRNNLITNVAQLQVGQSANFVYEHNTIYNLTSVNLLNSNSTNAIVQNNIFIGNATVPQFGDAGYGSCINCILRYSLCDDTGQCGGSNQIIGSASFVGGAIPTTWAGWQLAAGSRGKNGGNDGMDLGTLYYGPSSASTGGVPTAPTNLRISE